MFTHRTIKARHLAILATAAAVAGGPVAAVAVAGECYPTDPASVIPAGQPGGPATPPPLPTSLPPQSGDPSVIPAGQPGGPAPSTAGSEQSVIPAGQPGGPALQGSQSGPEQLPAPAEGSQSVIGFGQPDGFKIGGGRTSASRGKHVSLRLKRSHHRRSPRVRAKNGHS